MTRAYDQQWRAANPDYAKQWREAHPGAAVTANNRWRDKHAAQYLLGLARTNSKRRGKTLEFTLTIEWIEEHLAAGVCERTGHALVSVGTGGPWSPSIDRIDPSLGYTPDNCQIVCWIYNRAKGVNTDADVLEMAKWLVTSTDPD